MLPDKQAAVLADFRSKKATSATELAKLHGLSRSAVYRLLQSEVKKTAAVAAAAVTASRTSIVPSQPARGAPQKKSDDEGEEDEAYGSDEEHAFLLRSNKFAEDLGLPSNGSNLQNIDEDERPSGEREEELDGAVDAIFSASSRAAMPPEALNRIFAEPMRRPVEQVHVIPSIDRQDIIQRIIFNVQTFGPLLVTIVGPQPDSFIAAVQNMSASELTQTLTTLERTRSVGNIAAGFKQTFFMVTQATELTSVFVGIKAQGFTERMRAEEQQIGMIMKELAIDNWERVKAMDSPTARLGILFCMTLAQTDATNRLADALKPGLNSRVSPGTEAAHGDL